MRIRANFYHTSDSNISIGKPVKELLDETVGEAVNETPIKEEGEAGVKVASSPKDIPEFLKEVI